MFGLRAIPPTRSPLDARALFSGAAAAAAPARFVRLLETRLRERFGYPEVVLTDSGTSALMLALRHLCTETRVAAMPAWGCYDLATAAVGAGVRTRLYDLDAATLSPDPDSLAAAIASGVDVVVAVHFFGLPADLDMVRELSSPARIPVIEDAAQADGLVFADGAVGGSRGDFAVISFGRGKGLTGGGGGALLTHTSRQSMRPNGERRLGVGTLAAAVAQWMLGRPSLYGLPSRMPGLHLGETRYHAPQQPAHLTRTAAGVLGRTWDLGESERATRRRVAEGLRDQLAEASVPVVPIEPAVSCTPGWLRLPVLAGPETAAELRRPAWRARGILPAYPLPLGELPALRPQIVGPAVTPGARQLAEQLWTLPTHGALTRRDQDELRRALRDVAGAQWGPPGAEARA